MNVHLYTHPTNTMGLLAPARARKTAPGSSTWLPWPTQPTANRRRRAARILDPSAAEFSRSPSPSSSPSSSSSSSSSSSPPNKPALCCPVCFEPFSAGGPLACGRCGRSFTTVSGPQDIVDLTINSSLSGPQSVELFKNPLISTIYERGWRQGFAWAGFPGLDEEAAKALEVLQRASPSPKVLVDMSCGSGLFTKKFVASGQFDRVIAVDYSRSMLEETRNNGNATPNATTATTLIQADAARLPFQTGSIDAIHAGAAIHCWPDPVNAAAEMRRVLRRGGVFVGTTFLGTVAPLGQALANDDLLKPLRQFEPTTPNGFKWWYEDELRSVFEDCGFTFEVIQRKNRYIMFMASSE